MCNPTSRQKLLPFMPQPKWWHRPVSWLLWLANSDAPRWGVRRHAFYFLKDQILNGRSVQCGVDWQRITKDCWGCCGTGYYTHWSGDKDICNRCYGSGVYSAYYVKLQRLSFGGRVFHKPVGTQDEKPECDSDIIKGRIKHRRQGWKAVVAYAVLLAIFDRATLLALSKHYIRNLLRKVSWLFIQWMPCRCHECRCWMIRRNARSTISILNKRIGVLCEQCSDDVPF